MVDTGQGFFGKGYWGKRVLWYNVPNQHRALDTDTLLERLLQSWGDEMESFLEQIQYLPTQRDPYEVRAREGEGEWFYITEAMTWDDAFFGRVTRLIGEKDYTLMPETDEDSPPSASASVLAEWFPWFPYVPVEKTGRWWQATWNDAEFDVVRVRLRNYDQPAIYNATYSLANEIWVSGGDLGMVFDYLTEQDFTTIGTGDGSKTPEVTLPVTPVRLQYNAGTGTPAWYTADSKLILQIPMTPTATLTLYDVPDGTGETGNLYAEGGTPGEIDTGTSYGTVDYLSGQIVLDLTSHSGVSEYQGEIGAKWVVRGYFLEFYPPRLIDHLASDYGFDNDLNDPEDVQRSTIANVVKYFGLKASQDSYRIRGEISLFDVSVTPLWYMCDDNAALWADLPAESKFTYDGRYYTDLDPRVLHFDDISSDVWFYDPDTTSWVTLLDNAMMYQEATGDGYSEALAFALDVCQGYYGYVDPPPHPSSVTQRTPATIKSSTLLTDAEAASYGLVAGYRVVVEMMRVQADAFTFHKGWFGLTEYDKTGAVPPALGDSVFWIDVEDTAWTFTGAGATPEEDTGDWTVIVGVGVTSGVPSAGPTVGGDIAVRYWPEVSQNDCCFCRSYKVRVEMTATAEAYDYYETFDDIEAAAIRLKQKIENKLLPIHVRVAEWLYTQTLTVTQDDIFASRERITDIEASGTPLISTPFENATLIEMMVYQRGELDDPGEDQSFELWADGITGTLVWSAANQASGFSDPDTWYPVTGSPVDVTSDLVNKLATVISEATATVAFGDTQWRFEVTKSL